MANSRPAHAQSGGIYSYARSLPPIPAAPKTPLLPSTGANTLNGGATSPTHKMELLEPPDGRVYHGASLPDTWSESGLSAQLNTYQKLAGRKISVVTWFASCYQNGRLTSWHGQYLPVLRRVQAAGAMSLIKLSPQDDNFASNKKMADLRDITRGVYDTYFQEAADACHEFGSPLWISWCHEMNGNWYPYSQAYGPDAPSAGEWIAAWQHIVSIFRARHATNVAWMWSPNVPNVGEVPASDYYPGDEWVDWVGASFYSGNPLANLDSFYGRWASHKPIFINEWATGISKNRYYVGFPGESAWVTQVFQALQTRYPRVKGISWFQWDKSDGNYLLQRVPDQQQTYAREVASPRYIDSIPTPPASPTPPRDTPGREVVLREVPQDASPQPSTPPRQDPPHENVGREPVRPEAVPREQVKHG